MTSSLANAVPVQVGNRPLEKTSYRIFELAWRMGSLGAFAVAKEVAPLMAKRGHGTMIYTSSTAAFRGNAGQYAHAAAMAGRRMVTQALSHEYGPQGVHVAHVNVDGPVNAPETLGKLMPAYFEALKAEDDNRLLDPNAIADTYWHLHQQPRNAWTLELDLRPYLDTPWFNTG
jgi:NAD(P)-dependent dehydrogenase (short-subunit alcohol dehydrogenase family)